MKELLVGADTAIGRDVVTKSRPVVGQSHTHGDDVVVMIEPLDATGVAQVRIVVPSIDPLLKGARVHAFKTTTALTIVLGAIGITSRKEPEASSSHKEIEMIGRDIEPAVDDLNHEEREVRPPFLFRIGDTYLITGATFRIGGTAGDRIHKVG
jgi:hypothetical protein